MTIVKKSPLIGMVESMLANSAMSFELPPYGTNFLVEDLFSCHRRAVLSCSPPLPRAVPDPALRWRHAFSLSRDFSVLSENVYLSDSKMGLGAKVDLLVEYRGEDRFIVRFWESDLVAEDPTVLQVTDMVVSMCLSLVWSGIIFRHHGDDYKLHFLNPDRKDAKTIVSSAFEAASGLALSVMSGSAPEGTPAGWCSDCPHKGNCSGYQNIKEEK